MSLLETHFEKKLTAKLDFDQSAPLINTEIVNDQITQAEFNKIWLELKNSSDNYHQRVRRMFRICVVMSCILLVLAFLALLNVIGGKILIFMLLLVQVVGIKKKFEERIDAAKMALFESILQKSLEVNTSLSDLTISSTKLQKKLFGMREEFSTKGNVNKTLIPDMLKAFQEYKTNLIKIREEDLAEGTIERICLRMDTQTQKCAVQLDKLIEANLHPDQIIISGKAEIINVTALNMLELDDTRSTWSHEEDDRSVDRKFNAIY